MSEVYLYITMVQITLCTIVKKWKSTKSHLKDVWIYKIWYKLMLRCTQCTNAFFNGIDTHYDTLLKSKTQEENYHRTLPTCRI